MTTIFDLIAETMKEPYKRYQLLREAYAVIDGIPQEQFSLAIWSNGKKPSCGMVGCGGGWLASYPPFIEMGLRMRTGVPTYKDLRSFEALASFFGIPYFSAVGIFKANVHNPIYPDKVEWKRRVLQFLQSHGGI